jgi:predicted DNA-binding protein
MSTISLRLPESLHKQLRALAKQEGISINQFAATALAEKMSALMASEYLEQRARHGSRQKFEQALAKVSSTRAPEPDDQL